MRVLLAGGGTGGHIYPALAIAERLKNLHPECEILYVGTEKGLENRIVPQRDVPFQTIAVEGLPRKLNPALVKAMGKAVGGCLDGPKNCEAVSTGPGNRHRRLCVRPSGAGGPDGRHSSHDS